MHGSMMINFSLANQRAGNAGLGKLGPPSLCQQVGGSSEHWMMCLAWHCGLEVAKQAVRITARAPGSTRHISWVQTDLTVR